MTQNPYMPPSVGPDTPRSSVVRLGPRVFKWSLAAGVVYGLLAGVATCVQSDFGLRRFGGLEYVPRVITLDALRGWGVWGGVFAPAVTTVVVMHRAGTHSAERPSVDPRLSFFVAAAVLIVYPIVASVGWLVAIPIWCSDSGDTVRTFVGASREAALVPDIVHGLVATMINAVVLAIGVRVTWPGLLSRRWPLVPKLLVTWVALTGVSFAHGVWGARLG
jgi:hypothetical protein